MLTLLKLSDVNGEPSVKIDLPGPLRVGDPISLAFVAKRINGGRHEVLEVEGSFRVESVGLDASSLPHRQLVSVSCLGKVPTWRSVRKPSSGRRLGPAKQPPTSI